MFEFMSCMSPSSQLELRPLELKLLDVIGPLLKRVVAWAAVLLCREELEIERKE